jgi:MFS family permease
MKANPKGRGIVEWQRGWGVVLAAALGIAIGSIYSHFIGAMIPHLQKAYDWSRGEIAFGLTLIMGINLVASIVAGGLADRFGMRPIALCGVWLFAIGFSLLGLAGPQLWTWYAACVVFAMLAASVSAVIWTGGIVKWFEAQRGMALALTLTSGGLMVAITPSIIVALLGLVGVSWIFPVVGVTGAILMFIPTLRYFRDLDSVGSGAGVSVAPKQLPGYSFREAVVRRHFWQMLAAFVLVALAAGTYLVHIQPMLIDSGFSPAQAASMAFFVGPSMIVGRLTMGMLYDLFDPRFVSAVAFGLIPVAGFLLLHLDGNYPLAIGASILAGLCLGAEVDAVAYLISRYFGLKAYGLMYAVLGGAYGVATAVGSTFAGFGFDRFGTYDQWLLILMVGGGVAIMLVLTLGLPTKAQSEAVGSTQDASVNAGRCEANECGSY